MNEISSSKYEACPLITDKPNNNVYRSKHEACSLITDKPNNNAYQSKHEACPFLSDTTNDLRCDFEILSDEIASLTGFLHSLLKDDNLRTELVFICELIYHITPTLRTHLTVTAEELQHLETIVEQLKNSTSTHNKQFVLPMGNQSGALAHVLRAKCKALVRLLYRYHYQGQYVDELLLDITNLLSGYFFYLALQLNALDGVEEIPYISRNYR
jgi:ATP:cob(I)alamin adenosyltransferase